MATDFGGSRLRPLKWLLVFAGIAAAGWYWESLVDGTLKLVGCPIINPASACEFAGLDVSIIRAAFLDAAAYVKFALFVLMPLSAAAAIVAFLAQILSLHRSSRRRLRTITVVLSILILPVGLFGAGLFAMLSAIDWPNTYKLTRINNTAASLPTVDDYSTHYYEGKFLALEVWTKSGGFVHFHTGREEEFFDRPTSVWIFGDKKFHCPHGVEPLAGFTPVLAEGETLSISTVLRYYDEINAFIESELNHPHAAFLTKTKPPTIEMKMACGNRTFSQLDYPDHRCWVESLSSAEVGERSIKLEKNSQALTRQKAYPLQPTEAPAGRRQTYSANNAVNVASSGNPVCGKPFSP